MDMGQYMLNLLACLLVKINLFSCNDEANTIDIVMPAIQPQHNDDYYCTAVKLDPQKRIYIKKFIPHAEKSYAHHMLLYTCENPGELKDYWHCGEMGGTGEGSPVCSKEPKIIYAWAMNADALTLDNDISFEVGGDTSAKFLVLNVHYKNVSKFTDGSAVTDSSGFTLEVSNEKTPKLAGIYLLESGGRIPPHSKASQETACQINEATVMHPFAFRVHTHSHGVKVSGYKIHDDKWTLIGEMDPQEEQMFYPVKNPKEVVIEPSDYVAARCEFVNNEDRPVDTGPTQNDEMCNFYIMYYVDEKNKLIENSICTADGEWEKYFGNLDIDIPKSLMNPFDEDESLMNPFGEDDSLMNPFGEDESLLNPFGEENEIERNPDPMSLFMKLLKARQSEEKDFYNRQSLYMKRNDPPALNFYKPYDDESNYY